MVPSKTKLVLEIVVSSKSKVKVSPLEIIAEEVLSLPLKISKYICPLLLVTSDTSNTSVPVNIYLVDVNIPH